MKLVVVMLGTGVWEWLRYIGLLYADLFYTDPLLLLMVVTLTVLDWGTGVLAAVRRGESITSRRLRATARKVLEYAALIGVAVMVANAFDGSPVAIATTAIDDATLLYVAITEAVSVVENVSGSRTRAVYLWRQVRRVLKGSRDGEIIIEEIIRTKPLRDQETVRRLEEKDPPERGSDIRGIGQEGIESHADRTSAEGEQKEDQKDG